MKKLLWSAATLCLLGGSAMAVDNGVERYVGQRRYAIPPQDVMRAAMIGDSVSGTKMGGSTTLYMVSVNLDPNGNVELWVKDATGVSASSPGFLTSTGSGYVRANQGDAASTVNAWPVQAVSGSSFLGANSTGPNVTVNNNVTVAGATWFIGAQGPGPGVQLTNANIAVAGSTWFVGANGSGPGVQVTNSPNVASTTTFLGASGSGAGVQIVGTPTVNLTNTTVGVRANGDGDSTTQWNISVTVANGGTVIIPSGAVAVTIKMRPGGTSTAFIGVGGTMAYAVSAMGDAIFSSLPYADLARTGKTETLYLFPQDNETLTAHVWIKLNGCQCATQ